MPPEPPATAPLTLPTGITAPIQTSGHPFRDAVLDARGAGLAMLPIGLAFGVLVTQSGLDWWWATVFASIIYAGSLEFLLVGLVSVAAPLSQIAVTALLVNSRHVFYALSFPLHEVTRPAARVYSTFALTDEAYAITTSAAPQRLGTARIIWIQAIMHVLWVTGATAGALAGAALPAQLPGVGFALTALFTVLAIEAFRAKHDIPTPVLAIVSGAVAMLIAPGNMLLVGTSLFAVATVVRLLVKHHRERQCS